PQRELAPLVLTAERRETEEAIGGEGVLVDRTIADREAPGLAAVRRVEETTVLGVLEPIAKRERHAAGARERTRMKPGLVCVERGGEVRGEIAEQVAEPRAVARVEMEQRLRIRIREAPGDRPHRGVGALLDRAGSAKRGP